MMRHFAWPLALLTLTMACRDKREIATYPRIDLSKVAHLQGRWSEECIDWAALMEALSGEPYTDPIRGMRYWSEFRDDALFEATTFYSDSECQNPGLKVEGQSLVRDVGEAGGFATIDFTTGVDTVWTRYGDAIANPGPDTSGYGCPALKDGEPMSMRKDCRYMETEEGRVDTRFLPPPGAPDSFQIYEITDGRTLRMGLPEHCEGQPEGCEAFEGQDAAHRPRSLADNFFTKDDAALALVANEDERGTRFASPQVLELEVRARLRRLGLTQLLPLR